MGGAGCGPQPRGQEGAGRGDEVNGVQLESCTGGPGGLPQGGGPGAYLLPTAEPAAAPGGEKEGHRASPQRGGSDRAGEVTGLGEGDLEATCRAGPIYAISFSRPPSEEGVTLAHFVDGETESQSCD